MCSTGIADALNGHSLKKKSPLDAPTVGLVYTGVNNHTGFISFSIGFRILVLSMLAHCHTVMLTGTLE